MVHRIRIISVRTLRWLMSFCIQVITLPISIIVVILGWILRHLSENNAYRVSSVVTPIFFLPFHWLRLSNMKKVFVPLGWAHKQINELHRRHKQFVSEWIVDIARLTSVSTDDLTKKIVFEGEEYLTEGLLRGKGILLLNAHIGNWWYVRACLWLHHHSIIGVANKVLIVSVERHLQKVRSRFQGESVYVTTGGSRTAQRVFEQNGIFTVYFDVAMPMRWKYSSWLPFGHAAIHADHGPAKLALKSDATVLIVTSLKINSTQYCVRITPAPKPETMTDPRELHALWIDELYRNILNVPEQWWNWGAVLLRTSSSIGLQHDSSHQATKES